MQGEERYFQLKLDIQMVLILQKKIINPTDEVSEICWAKIWDLNPISKVLLIFGIQTTSKEIFSYLQLSPIQHITDIQTAQNICPKPNFSFLS